MRNVKLLKAKSWKYIVRGYFLFFCIGNADATNIISDDKIGDYRPSTPYIFVADDKTSNDLLKYIFMHVQNYEDLLQCSQVSWRWYDIAQNVLVQHYPIRLMQGKQKLFSLILEVTKAEPNEVQRARERVELLLQEPDLQKNLALAEDLKALLKNLYQPEELIINLKNYRKSFNAQHSSNPNHPALERLKKVTNDIQILIIKYTDLSPILNDVCTHYVSYLAAFKDPTLECNKHEVQSDRERVEMLLHEQLSVNLKALLKNLYQPEELIINLKNYREDLIAQHSSNPNHPALERLKKVTDYTQILITKYTDLSPVLNDVCTHYKAYLAAFKDPTLKCNKHIRSKAILTGEHFLSYPFNLGKFRHWQEVPMRSYRISQEMALQVLSQDEHGLLVKKNKDGSHPVSFISSRHSGLGVHFKANIGRTNLEPGKESALYWFSQVLFKRGMAPSALVTLNNVDILSPEGSPLDTPYKTARKKGLTAAEFFAKHPNSERFFKYPYPFHILQASYHIEGEGLDDIMRQETNQLKEFYQQLHLETFNEQIILSLLTNPEDGKPDNFRVMKDNNGRLHIVGIDNDMALGPAVVACGKLKDIVVPTCGKSENVNEWDKWHMVGVKNILYCLPNMNKPLMPQLIAKLKSFDSDQILLQWFYQIVQDQQGYECLTQYGYDHYTKEASVTEEEKTTTFYLTPCQYKDINLSIKISQESIYLVKKSLNDIQLALKDNRALTLQQLFLRVHPLTARFYQAMAAKYSSLPIFDIYQYIHEGRKVKYLEEILDLEELLTGCQTVGQALKEATDKPHNPNRGMILSSAANLVLREVNVNQASRNYFMTAISYLTLRKYQGYSFEETNITTQQDLAKGIVLLHPSWYNDNLLLRLLDWQCPPSTVRFILDHFNPDVGILDNARGWTVLHHAVNKDYPSSVLQKIYQHHRNRLLQQKVIDLDSITTSMGKQIVDYQLNQWLNKKGEKDSETPLSLSFRHKNLDTFVTLIRLGAISCSPMDSINFYKRVIEPCSDQVAIEAFVELIERNQALRWRLCLDCILPESLSMSSEKRSKRLTEGRYQIQASQYMDRVLLEPIVKQIIKGDEFVACNQDGRHTVSYAYVKQELKASRLIELNHGIYFKVYPELPGLEAAVGILTRQLLGFGAPEVELAKLFIDQQTYPVLLSHSHGGPKSTLENILKTCPEILSNLDPTSVSGMIIAAMLINPEDGKPANYVVEDHPSKLGKYRIVGVDNDHAFVPAVVRENPERKMFSTQPVPVAQVKTVLYCLDQMKDTIDPEIRQLFIDLQPAIVLKNWLEELRKINSSYTALFGSDTECYYLFDKHDCFIGVPFQSGMIARLYDKFILLRDCLTKNPDIKHINLLSKLEPRLAKRYAAALSQETLSPLQRFEQVDQPFYITTKTGSNTTVTRSGDILRSMDIPLEESVFTSIQQGKAFGPIQGEEELDKIVEERHSEILKKLAISAGDLNFFLTKASLVTTQADFLAKLDFKNLAVSEQEAVLRHLKGKNLPFLNLHNCTALSDTIFSQNISLTYLTKADLRGCNGISYRSLLALSTIASNLEELNLQDITTLDKIGNFNIFNGSPLVFDQLQVLNLGGCKELTKVLIKAPQLYWLSVEDCISLKDKDLDEGIIANSPKLTKLRLSGAKLISNQELRKKYPRFLFSEIQGLSNPQAILDIFETQGYELELKNIDRSFQGLSVLFKALAHNTSIISLNLGYYNTIGNKGAKAIGQGLSFNESLENLNLEGNNIKDKGAKLIGQGLINNKTLRDLSLKGNKISKNGKKEIKQILASNETLSLDLRAQKKKVKTTIRSPSFGGSSYNVSRSSSHHGEGSLSQNPLMGGKGPVGYGIGM